MGMLKGLGGAVLWILSLVLTLVALLLCVTIILLPVGIPLLGYARRLFTLSLKLMLPRAVTHPMKTADDAVEKRRRWMKKDAADTGHEVKQLGRRGGEKAKNATQKATKKARKTAKRARKKAGKKTGKTRKRLPFG
jgi:hypothetical protein